HVPGFIVDRCTGQIGQLLLHQAADLEFHRSLLGHLNRLQSFGFCARRALRNFVSNTPKSRNSRRLPLPSSEMISSRNCWTTRLTCTRRWPVESAMRSMSSFLVMAAVSFLAGLAKIRRDPELGYI